MKTLKDFNFNGKKVLLRVDFNVPVSDEGEILDDFRIRKAIPTIEYLIKKGAKIIIMSHLGRPLEEIKNSKSKIQNHISKYSLKPISEKLGELLGRPAKFLRDCVGKEVERGISVMKPKGIVFLENLRFYKEEEENNEEFVKELSSLGDIFINDAFSVCHRAHASVVGITQYLPSGIGFLLAKEIEILSQIIKEPKRPLLVIIGGKKVEDKVGVIEKFSEIADFLLIGGLAAQEMRAQKMKLKYPSKIFLSQDGNNPDIGKETLEFFKNKIVGAKTIFWSGPLGKIEDEKYQRGSLEIAEAIIESGAFSVAGGGDTVEFITKIGFLDKFNHVSIGGSAMLEFLAGKKLPGIEALQNEDKKFKKSGR